MHVYFVRHGETVLNSKHIHQSPNTPLSPNGREGIVTLAEALRGVNPSIILSSEYTRALESARIIGSRVGLSPITNGLFYEIIRPSKFFLKSIFSPETFWYVFQSMMHRNKASWRYADAENFVEVSNRAKKALQYLESLRENHSSVVVVSHTVFINIMVSYMCKDRLLDIRDLFLTFFHIEKMKNGEVIHMEYVGDGSTHTCNWRRVS